MKHFWNSVWRLWSVSSFCGFGKVRINGGFFVFLAFAFVFVPFEWLSSWILAAVIHELGHITSIRAGGHSIYGLDISLSGARILTDDLGRDEWYCALAGPIFALFLVLTIRVFPRLGICAIFQTCVNLLPIYPMDGGRVIRSVICNIWSEEQANRILKIVACIVTLILIVLISRMKDTGLAYALITILILTELKTYQRKIPCKRRVKWVQ